MAQPNLEPIAILVQPGSPSILFYQFFFRENMDDFVSILLDTSGMSDQIHTVLLSKVNERSKPMTLWEPQAMWHYEERWHYDLRGTLDDQIVEEWWHYDLRGTLDDQIVCCYNSLHINTEHDQLNWSDLSID